MHKLSKNKSQVSILNLVNCILNIDIFLKIHIFTLMGFFLVGVKILKSLHPFALFLVTKIDFNVNDLNVKSPCKLKNFPAV